MSAALIVLISLLGALFAYFLMFLIPSLFVSKKREYNTNSKFYRFLINNVVGVIRFFARADIVVGGTEKLPEGTRFLMVGNHRSNFDPLFTWYALKKYDLAFVSKPENFKIPMFGRIIRKCCFMPIDRENARKAIKTILRSAELIKSGEVSVFIYPEGTRSKNSSLLPFHNGVFKAAQKAEAPIAVCAIRGTEAVHKNFPFRRSRINIDIINVLSPELVIGMSTDEIGAEVFSELENALK